MEFMWSRRCARKAALDFVFKRADPRRSNAALLDWKWPLGDSDRNLRQNRPAAELGEPAATLLLIWAAGAYIVAIFGGAMGWGAWVCSAIVGGVLLGGCGAREMLTGQAEEEKRVEAEAAAVGGACRQSGRSVESCFQRNKGLQRAGALKGWREMDEYLRANKLVAQEPPPEPMGGDEHESGSQKMSGR